MASPQNSPRGRFAKERVDVGSQQLTYNSTTLNLSGGIKVSGAAGGVITANSTSANFAKGVKVSNGAGGLLTANSTGLTLAGTLTLGGAITGSDSTTNGIVLTATAALPGDASLEGFAFLSNSTGNALLINTTGTTWKYLNVTAAQPT